MPYIIIKVKGGFKVAKKSNPKEVFSKKPLTKKMAEKQKIAIEISERLANHKRQAKQLGRVRRRLDLKVVKSKKTKSKK